MLRRERLVTRAVQRDESEGIQTLGARMSLAFFSAPRTRKRPALSVNPSHNRPMRSEKLVLVEYLKTKTGGALVMTPRELAVEIRVSPKQQSKLRQEGRFPIPHQHSGRTILYSLYAVADFLFDGAQSVPSPEPEEVRAPLPKQVATKTAGGHSIPSDMSHLFLLRGFASGLDEQKARLDVLCPYFAHYLKAAPLSDKLEAELNMRVDEKKLPRSF